MRSVNRVTLIGNIGNDPELRTTTGGQRVAQLSLATSRQWNSASGEKQEKTEWHRCVAWNSKRGQLADIIEKYAKKGDRLYVEGRVEYRQWQDKDGNTRYATEINVDEIMLLSARGANEGSNTAPGQGRAVAAAAPAKQKVSDEFEDFPDALEDEDDSLPF